VERTSRAACITFDSGNNRNIIIENFHFTFCHGIYATAARGNLEQVTIRNCQFSYNPIAIAIFARHGHDNRKIAVEDNEITNAGQAIIIGSYGNGTEVNHQIVVKNNAIFATGFLNGREPWSKLGRFDEEAIGLQNLSDSTVAGNKVSGGAKGGGISYWANGKAQSFAKNTYSRNYIHDIEGACIIIGGSGSNNSQSVISYNLLVRCGLDKSKPNGALRLNRPQVGRSIVHNNTIIGGDLSVFLNSLSNGYIISNNISAAPMYQHVYRGEIGIAANALRRNLYFPDGPKKYHHRGVDLGFAQWRQATKRDGDSVTAVPLFENSTLQRFSLQPSSPAIDAGIPISGVNADYAGKPIYGLPDLGAYEFQPPYRAKVDRVGVGDEIRVYGDGRFWIRKRRGGDAVALGIVPTSNDTKQWLDVVVTRSEQRSEVSWVASSINVIGPIIHSIQGMLPNTLYEIRVDGVLLVAQRSSQKGEIEFSWEGDYSVRHTFSIQRQQQP
jgi:hypothetical protein